MKYREGRHIQRLDLIRTDDGYLGRVVHVGEWCVTVEHCDETGEYIYQMMYLDPSDLIYIPEI